LDVLVESNCLRTRRSEEPGEVKRRRVNHEDEERVRRGDETARYLSKEAWENLSPEEREATQRKKREG
jgi:hypothetical protein